MEERIVLEASIKELKHSVRFNNPNDTLLKSIYLTREGLIKCFGKDTMNRIVVTIESEDYSDLLNREFKVVGDGRDEVEGLLVDVDFDVGITIIDKNNKDHYIYCLRGKSYYNKSDHHRLHPEYYKDIFEGLITGIRKGEINRTDINEIRDKHGMFGGSLASSENCPFNK